MRSAWNFLQYNNAVPIGLFLLFGAGTAAFAASPTGQQAMYSAQDKVVSVDNSYIVAADIPHFNFDLQITGITQDASDYYVAYTYNTIDVVDYVWKPVTKSDTLKYSITEMQGQDLGLAVSKQLSQLMSEQAAYLTSVQAHEKANGQTQKVVATQYSGLVGKFLNPTEKAFPGYTPVVDELASATTSTEQLAALGLVQGEAANAAAAAHNAITPGTPAATSTAPTQDEINAVIQQRVNDILAQQAQDAANAAAAAAASAANNPPPVVTQPVQTPVYVPPPVVTSPPVVTPPVDTTPPADTPPATTTPPADTSSTTPATTPPADTSTPTTTAPDTTAPAADTTTTPASTDTTTPASTSSATTTP